MLWVLKRTISMRRFFWAAKTYVQTDGLENIKNYMLKNVVLTPGLFKASPEPNAKHSLTHSLYIHSRNNP